MRINALLLAALVAAAVAAPEVSRAQAAPRIVRDNDKPPKPKPKPHKSDDDGDDDHGHSGISGSELADRTQIVVALRNELKAGTLVSVAGAPICREAQSELLSLLTNSNDTKSSSASSCIVTATTDARDNPALRPQLVASAAGILDKDNSSVGGAPPVTLSPLYLEGAPNAAARRAMILVNFTAAGAPADKASALLGSLTGILSRPHRNQLTESIDGFNRLVAAAPDDFLKNPPTYFLAVHAVLARLVGADSK